LFYYSSTVIRVNNRSLLLPSLYLFRNSKRKRSHSVLYVYHHRLYDESYISRMVRIVVPDYPHHVIQQGIHTQPVFFSALDRHTYIHWTGSISLLQFAPLGTGNSLSISKGSPEGLCRKGNYRSIRCCPQISSHIYHNIYFSALSQSYVIV